MFTREDGHLMHRCCTRSRLMHMLWLRHQLIADSGIPATAAKLSKITNLQAGR